MTDLNNEINEIKGKSWNECITPRKEYILQGFKEAWWQFGVGAYLANQLAQLQKRLYSGCENPRDEDRLRGQILMLMELVEFPETIKRQIELAEKPQAKPAGNAGY